MGGCLLQEGSAIIIATGRRVRQKVACRKLMTMTDTGVQTKTFDGRQATNREGAAAYLGMPIGTVRVYSSPAQRSHTGWPAPIRVKGDPDSERQDWFAVGDLDTYRSRRTPSAGTAAPPVSDPGRLLDLAQFAALRGVTRQSMYRYLELSTPAWQAGHDGLLPRPDQSRPARHGTSHRWRTDRATAWAFPDQPRHGTGRPTGRRPTPDDLAQLLAEPNNRDLTNGQLAQRLAERLHTQVSLQTVHRLKRKLRDTGKMS